MRRPKPKSNPKLHEPLAGPRGFRGHELRRLESETPVDVARSRARKNDEFHFGRLSSYFVLAGWSTDCAVATDHNGGHDSPSSEQASLVWEARGLAERYQRGARPKWKLSSHQDLHIITLRHFPLYSFRRVSVGELASGR